jgi:hypothetical protein
MASQLTSQDPTGQFGTGAEAFCDLLGQLAGSTGGDPATLCTQLASQDPSGQFSQLCDAFGSAPLPTGGVPTSDGGLIGDTLEATCDQIASQDPSGQLVQLCDALGTLPI